MTWRKKSGRSAISIWNEAITTYCHRLFLSGANRIFGRHNSENPTGLIAQSKQCCGIIRQSAVSENSEFIH